MEALAPTSRKEFFESFFPDSTSSIFIDFLFDRTVRLPIDIDLSNAHSAALAIFSAIQTENETLFRHAYDELSRRQIQRDSPWLMNDPLFYGLVLGFVKFKGDCTWLQQALKFRMENTKDELHDISATFSDILAENWGSLTNIRPLILMAKHHLKVLSSSPDLLNSVYRSTTSTSFPYHESNFLNAIYLRAFDIVIISKAPENPARQAAIEKMIQALWNRSGAIGSIVWIFGMLFFSRQQSC